MRLRNIFIICLVLLLALAPVYAKKIPSKKVTDLEVQGDMTFGVDGTCDLPDDTVQVSDIDATGTPGSSTYYRGDGTWSTPSGAGDITDVGDCGNGACFQTSTYNTVFAGESGGGIAAFRALVDDDIPNDITIDGAGIATDLDITGQTLGDILYFDGTNWIRLAKGSDGQVLHSTATIPAWDTDDGAGAASIEDDAYSATDWNGDAVNGATRNAIFDYLIQLDTDSDGDVDSFDATALAAAETDPNVDIAREIETIIQADIDTDGNTDGIFEIATLQINATGGDFGDDNLTNIGTIDADQLLPDGTALVIGDNSGTVFVDGTNVDIDTSGNMDIAGTMDITGAATLDSTLAVAGASTLTGAVTGTGWDIDTNGDADVNDITVGGEVIGNLTVAGTLSTGGGGGPTISAGTALPGTCTAGDLFIDTDGDASAACNSAECYFAVCGAGNAWYYPAD